MKKFLLIFCLSLGSLSFAQFEFDKDLLLKNLIGTIESDRPGQALNATTCGILAIQVQSGFNYTNLDFPLAGTSKNMSVPTNIRFGISKMWELNTSFSYQNENLDFGFGQVTIDGFPSPEIGLRCAFLKGNKWKPFLALQANMRLPSNKGAYTQSQMGSSFYLVTSNRFEHISVNATVGMLYNGFGGNAPNYPYVLNIGSMLTDNLGAFVEVFGNFNTDGIALDGGFSYLIGNNFQLDLFGGWLGDTSWFGEIGFSWRYSFFQNIMKKGMSNLEKTLSN